MKLNEISPPPEYPELKKSEMRRLVPLTSEIAFNEYTQAWFGSDMYQITLFDRHSEKPVGLIEGKIVIAEWNLTRNRREISMTERLHVIGSISLEGNLREENIISPLCSNRRFEFMSGDEPIKWDVWEDIHSIVGWSSRVAMVRYDGETRAMDVVGPLDSAAARSDVSLRLVATNQWSSLYMEAEHRAKVASEGEMITPSGRPVE